MTTVRFLQDFQGVETNGVFYKHGEVVDVPSNVASRCVADKRAELVVAPKIETEEAPGTPVTESAYIVTKEPERLPDVVVDEPAPVMTSTTHATRKKAR